MFQHVHFLKILYVPYHFMETMPVELSMHIYIQTEATAENKKIFSTSLLLEE